MSDGKPQPEKVPHGVHVHRRGRAWWPGEHLPEHVKKELERKANPHTSHDKKPGDGKPS